MYKASLKYVIKYINTAHYFMKFYTIQFNNKKVIKRKSE